MSYKIAVVGATGSVGREILNALAERNFPAEKVVAFASSKSIGVEVSYGEDKTLPVDTLEVANFKDIDLVFSAVKDSVAKTFIPKATAAGCIVIDNSSLFRLDPEIPLIVTEVNAESLSNFREHNIIASPNCVAISLSIVLKPLHDIASIKRVVVSTYQSTSGAGFKAMDELFSQARAVFMNNPVKKEHFTKQIAFNVIPHIDDFGKDGYTGEESKVMNETKKILDPSIEITATCVRVPVFIGHAISANIEFDSDISETQARKVLKQSNSVSVIDHRVDEGYITPIECVGEDKVFISRIRKDPTVAYGLSLWIVADNIRKGAALNMVQIAEHLVESYM